MSLLPGALRGALAALAEGRARKSLAERSQAITAGYRQRRGSDTSIATDDDALAYALARMPATYAAAEAVFERLIEAAPDFAPATLLDVGCGPGTVSFAAAQAFPALQSIVMLDRNRPLLALAGKLAVDGLPNGEKRFEQADILSAALPTADLVVAGYLLAELAGAAQEAFVHKLWQAAGQGLVLIEPGTPDGFARLRAARTALVAVGAQVAAPCTHENTCPMTGEHWCRFLARVQRSRDHRMLKHGDRPFEDEPYAYLAVVRGIPAARASHRIITRVVETKPGATLDLCGANGRSSHSVPRRDKEKFRIYSRLRWGDPTMIQAPTEGGSGPV